MLTVQDLTVSPFRRELFIGVFIDGKSLDESLMSVRVHCTQTVTRISLILQFVIQVSKRGCPLKIIYCTHSHMLTLHIFTSFPNMVPVENFVAVQVSYARPLVTVLTCLSSQSEIHFHTGCTSVNVLTGNE